MMADDIERRLRQAGADADLILLIMKEAERKRLPPPPPPDPVATLLSKARKQERENKLTTPSGDNALETYQEVLQLAPGQAAALAGVRRIKEHYLQRGKKAEEGKEWKKAQTNYQEALEIDPGDQWVVAALKRVGEPQPQNQPPQITHSFPNEHDFRIHPGESPSFLVEAKDPDNGALSYTWFVDGQKVAEGKRFAFTTGEVGRRYRVGLEVTDQGGLKTEVGWNVQVEISVAKVEPRLSDGYSPPEPSLPVRSPVLFLWRTG